MSDDRETPVGPSVTSFDATQYRWVLALAGLAFLLAAWAPAYTARRPLSLPMALTAAGMIAFAVPGMPTVDPRQHPVLAEHLTEFGVIIALLGAGLKLDRPIGIRRWEVTWRLLGIAMILTIAATATLGWALAGLAPASALLLGAALAPTDPVLAADVQVGEPSVEDDSDDTQAQRHQPEDEVRFSLTSEAGLNDGLAFPFVYAALAVATDGAVGNWIGPWVLGDVFARIAIGITLGWLIGYLLGRVSFRPPWRLTALADAQDGFVALAATLLAYGVTELAHGYGFVAVFVSAVAMRASERGNSYHRVLHNFAGQVEQVVVIALLILLGGAVTGGLLSALTWTGALVGFGLVLVIRPLSAAVSMLGARVTNRERHAIGFFGIRGVCSLYYLAFALERAAFEQTDELWAIAVFTILASIVVHGVTSTPVMEHLDRLRTRRRNHGARMSTPADH